MDRIFVSACIIGRPVRFNGTDNLVRDAQIENIPFGADTTIVHHVELGHSKWRGDFILDHFGSYALTDDLVAVFQLADPAYIYAAGTVEF